VLIKAARIPSCHTYRFIPSPKYTNAQRYLGQTNPCRHKLRSVFKKERHSVAALESNGGRPCRHAARSVVSLTVCVRGVLEEDEGLVGVARNSVLKVVSSSVVRVYQGFMRMNKMADVTSRMYQRRNQRKQVTVAMEPKEIKMTEIEAVKTYTEQWLLGCRGRSGW
jgi:hypothetical protein